MSDQQDTELKITAGAYLRNLREEKGFSIADVTAQIYLKRQIIEALERDDYDSLPSRAYIHGYLQSYAKFLNVSAEHVLTLYRNEAPYEQPEQSPETPAASIPVTQESNRWLRVSIYLFLFVLVLGSFALWYNRDILLPLIPQEPPPPVSGRLDYPITIVEHPKDPFFRAPNTENAEFEPAPEPTDTRAPSTAEAPAAPGAQVQSADIPVADPGEQPQDTFTATSFAGSALTSGNGPDRIRLVVNIDCWIEVFDADNEKVFYDLARAGQTLQLGGTAPFSVLLGNADAASVEFNNVPFDFTPYITGIGIARFVLGEDQ